MAEYNLTTYQVFVFLSSVAEVIIITKALCAAALLPVTSNPDTPSPSRRVI